jgi:hypothetical protein
MSVWETYPADYRTHEVQATVRAVRAGECVSLVGLSGAGKSNLTGFLAHRSPLAAFAILVDCNRLTEPTPSAFLHLLRRALEDTSPATDEFAALDAAVAHRLARLPNLCLILDRFDSLNASSVAANLRSLRDAHKYSLTYVTATRRPLDTQTELAELFYAHTLWLGPLSESDARWNVRRYAERQGLTWDEATTARLIARSGGYPSLLRGVCEAAADGCPLEAAALGAHAAIQQRVAEFWADAPSEEHLRLSGLAGHPWLSNAPIAAAAPETNLTAKEHLLLEHFRAHSNQVCEKDELIHAVWPEDKIYTRGIRDDSLAQLIRRLREKIEPDPSSPRHIHTVPGRGYRYLP